MLAEYQQLYREALEKRKSACVEDIESLNVRAQMEIKEYLQPTFSVSIRKSSGQQNQQNYTSLEGALLEQCAEGFPFIEYIIPRFNDTVKNTKGNSLNIVTGKYHIRGHNCEGFVGPTILDKIQKMLDPDIIVKIEPQKSLQLKVRIEVPV